MTLRKLGIGRPEILAAAEDVLRDHDHAGAETSRNTYLLCPPDDRLVDLKICLRAALSDAGHVQDFTTRTFLPDVLGLGFTVLRFEEAKRRPLGVWGFDPAALRDAHVLLLPDGSEMPQGALPALASDIGGPPGRLPVSGARFIRDPALVRQVRDRANGRCEGCGKETFPTPSGEMYLEVHHKTWLSEGGADRLENMIALCPLCHCREHFGTERKYR